MVYVGITTALENKVDMLHPGKPDRTSNRLLLPWSFKYLDTQCHATWRTVTSQYDVIQDDLKLHEESCENVKSHITLACRLM